VISWFQSFGFQLQLASLHLGNPPTTARTALGWTTITSITFTNDGGFNTGACTSAGIFTAPVDGYYYAGASIRIDGAGSGYFRVIISINDGACGIGLCGHSIMGSNGMSPDFHTLAVNNIVKVSAGDTVRFKVNSNSDTSYTTHSQSHISVYMLAEA
jgi:hypothetical protein